jgi:hypothetical protein
MASQKAVALTDQELKRMANAKFAEAAALPPGSEQQILDFGKRLSPCGKRRQLAYKRFASAEVNGGESPRRGWRLPCKHLKRALAFERMADREENPQIRAVFEKQAAAYPSRRPTKNLAWIRAGLLGNWLPQRDGKINKSLERSPGKCITEEGDAIVS